MAVAVPSGRSPIRHGVGRLVACAVETTTAGDAVRQVNFTIGNDPYLLEHISELLADTGRPFHLDAVDHGWRYHIAYSDHPPGPPVDAHLLTDRSHLAAALRAHLALTRTALDDLPAALTYAASGHLGFPHLDTLTGDGILTGDEPDLWRLIAHGTPNPQIAHTLGYSPRTLQRLLPAFYRLIDATDKPHATRLCSRAVAYPRTGD